MAKTMQEIAELLQKMKFRKKLFGVDEADVWRQLENLHREYQAAFDAQAAANAALLKEREDTIAQLLAKSRRPAQPAAAPAAQPQPTRHITREFPAQNAARGAPPGGGPPKRGSADA